MQSNEIEFGIWLTATQQKLDCSETGFSHLTHKKVELFKETVMISVLYGFQDQRRDDQPLASFYYLII